MVREEYTTNHQSAQRIPLPLLGLPFPYSNGGDYDYVVRVKRRKRPRFSCSAATSHPSNDNSGSATTVIQMVLTSIALLMMVVPFDLAGIPSTRLSFLPPPVSSFSLTTAVHVLRQRQSAQFRISHGPKSTQQKHASSFIPLYNNAEFIDTSSTTVLVNENTINSVENATVVPSLSALTKQKNGTNKSSRNVTNKNQPSPRPRRIIPPTEMELQQLKQIRQEAYEKVCGPSSLITYDDDDDENTTILIDAGATYNATAKEFIFGNATTLSPPPPNNNNNTRATVVPTSMVTNATVLENVYVQLNATSTIQNNSTNIDDATIFLPRKKKPKPASLWSFESLFPEPVWDTESIEKDLYRNTNSNNRTVTAANVNNSNNKTSTRSSSSSPPNLDRSLQNSVPATTTTIRATNPKPIDTFLYGGSGVIRKEKKSKPQNLNNSSAARNLNSTGKVDPLLTRMVEDRVYGYRRLPTGVLQYETSLIGPDNAIQFRNGVRLGNPLTINADILSYLAKKELQRGRIEEACELYEKAVSIDPADGRAYLGLSKCAERRRDFTLARKWLVQGIQRSVSVQQLQSPTQKQRGNTSNSFNRNNVNSNEFEERYTETTTLVPDRGANPFLLQALGCLEEKLGRLTQAETLYAEAVKSRPYHTAAWVSLAVLRTRKLGYPVRAGRECFQCAERELQIAQQAPSSYVYTSWANLEYHKANDKNRARELFQKAIQIDPQCSAAWLQLGVLEAACENWEAAELCFEKVLKFDQRNTRVLQAYAIMETKRPSGDSRKAIGMFERAVQTNPRDAGVYQPYALYVAELGDMDMARLLLQKGTQVNKRHAAVWQAWGVLETRYGDADTARKIFQEGIWACGQVSGSQSGGYHCDRLWQAWGVLEANEKEYAAARRCFSRALDANNRNVPAFTAWALMEEQLGNVKDARMIFERGLRKFSTGSEEKKALYRSYELMEQRLGDTTAAQNIYQRSIREVFVEKDEIDILRTGITINKRNSNDETYIDDTTSAQQQTAVTKKKAKEFEVVRWENTGGEVWLNDRAIEAKVSISNNKIMPSRDGRKKDAKSNDNSDTAL